VTSGTQSANRSVGQHRARHFDPRRCHGSRLATLLHGVSSPIVGMLVINLIFLIVHTVMEAAPSIVVVTPILLPAITALHINPIQLGVLIVLNSGVGMILPPMGILTYLTASIAKVRAGPVFRTVLPYAAALIFVLLLVLFARGPYFT